MSPTFAIRCRRAVVAWGIGIICIPCVGHAQDLVYLAEFQSLYQYEVISDATSLGVLNNIIAPNLWTVKVGSPAPVLTSDQVNQVLANIPQSTLGTLCNFQLLDATKDSQYELIAVSDPNGRGSCNAYSVFRGGATSWSWQPFEAAEILDMASTIKDLNGTGTPELVIPQAFAISEHTLSTPQWTSIYEWDSVHGRYVPRDEGFPAVYQARLAVLNNIISQDEANTLQPPQILSEDSSSAYMERDRILRFLNTDSAAGLSRASTWAQGNDNFLKYRAIITLGQIGGTQANQQLQTLSHDSDQFVAAMATQALKPAVRGDLNHDGQVDLNDLNIIDAFLNTSITDPNDPRDLNHDGKIDALDARILTTLCTYPRCATHP